MGQKFTILFLVLFAILQIQAHKNSVQIATLKYGGGGDWYANPTALPNLISFANTHIPATISTQTPHVDVGSPDLFRYPYVYMTGHGNVFFTESDVRNLRLYLTSGGFLHIDDNYGLDRFARREMKKVFPEQDFVELPKSHPIYNQTFNFPNGLPKIHEHDGKPPQGFGLFHKGRLVCFYTYECDLGNGWEDAQVHSLSHEKRLEALKMGVNILQYVFAN